MRPAESNPAMITLCPNDEELLAVASGDEPSSELKSHLKECNRCARKIQGLKGEVRELKNVFGTMVPSSNAKPTTPMAPRIPPSSTPTQNPAPPPTTPPMIGKYLVVGALGSGGQASVYRAVHPVLNEQVVLKLGTNAPDDGDPTASRLVAEGRVLCQLKHPNIGRIYDLDFFQRRPFLVMEFVRGRALDQYARDRTKLNSLEIAGLGAKIARALESAHKLGIVHQDVKPQNIIIDETDVPKLIDFGMARLNGAWNETELQPLGGTIQYMAPEQARGERKAITGQVDVFALGAVLYFLITGSSPFGGGTRESNLTRARQCSFELAPLEKSTVSPALKKIVLKALAAKPEDRFNGAKEMAEALESIQRSAARGKWLKRAVPVLVAGVGIAATVALWPKPLPTPAPGQLLITPDGVSSLEGNLPLMTGEKVKIQGLVPRDTPAAVFWIGSGGDVFRMPVSRTHGPDQFDKVFCPDESKTTEVSGKAGTEFLLMVSGTGLDDPAKSDALLAQLKAFFSAHTLAELPPTGAVLIDPTGAHARFLDGATKSRDPGMETPDACAQVSTPLDELSRTLKEHGYFFAGIAVAHADAQN